MQKLPENPNQTIEEARAAMRPFLKGKGVICPCCSRPVKIYTRKINSSMVKVLMLIYAHCREKSFPPDYFFHVEDFLKKKNEPSAIRADYHKLRYWGLLEPSPNEREDGNPSNGYYKLTEKGMKFVEGKILVQKSVKIYNNKFYGFEGPEQDIWTAINNKFNYSEVLGVKPVELGKGLPALHFEPANVIFPPIH